MRELDREDDSHDTTRLRCAIVGPGRLGRALSDALRAAGVSVDGPLGRGAPLPAEADVVLLCVPDGAIADAAAALPVRPGQLVGHCSGATTLAPLAPHEAFSLHPLMTVPADAPVPTRVAGADADAVVAGSTGRGGRAATVFAGASAAVAGSTERARRVATALAETLGMTPFPVADEDRAAYHAAASVASNFLVTLEAAAERLAASAGVERAALVPLVRASVENWAALGPERALTGPIARGDEATVARQRAAIAERTPELVALYDVLAETTRALAAPSGDAARTEPAAPATAARPLAEAAR